MEYFNFIGDQIFRDLLNRDFAELESCVKNKASKSVLILSGSIIEATLLEYFTHNLPSGKTKAQLLKMGLADLIDEAETVGLVSSKSKALSTVVKDYRNLIHPGREIRKKEKFDTETALVSYSLVKIILNEIEENYVENYGYKAEDLLNKINLDSATHSIYEKLLLKLNHYEKIRLLGMLIDEETETTGSFLGFPPKENYIKLLKPLVGNEELTLFCKKLVSEVEQGSKSKIFALFNIFGSDLDLLDAGEQELILEYIYSYVFSKMNDYNDNIEKDEFRELFRYIGLNLNTPSQKGKFFDLLLRIIKLYNSTKKDRQWACLSAYKRLTSKLSQDKISKCEDYIGEKISEDVKKEFLEALKVHSDLPF